jgi:hypothetical protein
MADGVESLGIELVQAARAGRAVHNQLGSLQDAQVLGDRGAADGQIARDFADGEGAGQQPFEDGAPDRVA